MPIRHLCLSALLGLGASAQPLVQGPLILLIGAPGAGKSTQSAALSKAYGLPVITAEDLVKSNPDVFAKIRESKIKGIEPRTDPVLSRLFEERLKSGDAAKGVIVDGYPATKDHADALLKLVDQKRLPPPIVVQLDIPDEEARKRLAGNAEYTPEKLEQLLKDYHREFDMVKLYFPKAEIHAIDGMPQPAEVTKKIRAVLDKKVPATGDRLRMPK